MTPHADARENRIILGNEPEDGRHDGEGRRPNLHDRLPAVGAEHEWSEELRDRGAHISGAENAEGLARRSAGKPARNIGNARREGAAGNADAERRQKHFGICGGVRHQKCRNGADEHRSGQHHAAAVVDPPRYRVRPG